MVVLEVEDHLGTPAELLPRRITSDGERTTSLGLPHVLLVVVVLRADDDPLGKGDGVEANTELLLLGGLLSPQGDGALLKVFHLKANCIKSDNEQKECANQYCKEKKIEEQPNIQQYYIRNKLREHIEIPLRCIIPEQPF